MVCVFEKRQTTTICSSFIDIDCLWEGKEQVPKANGRSRGRTKVVEDKENIREAAVGVAAGGIW